MRWVFGFVLLVFTATAALAEIGDDGLHKAPWMRDTFKDLAEDLAEAGDEGKRLMVLIEQRGCIYCRKMHEEVFVIPEIAQYIEDNYFVVQINMFGDVEVTDFDGTTLSEKEMARRWGALFTPSIYFFPEEVSGDKPAVAEAVATMPGAFGQWTTLNMLTWVVEKGYESDEPFQKYHARKFAEQGG
ncbi:MAG: thioredoxin family protein [Pseudomonadota bacterium]